MCSKGGLAGVTFPDGVRRVIDGRPEPIPRNCEDSLALRERFAALAGEAGVTLAQLSLAWVSSRGEHLLAIPGTTCVVHLHENLGTPQTGIAPELLEHVSALMQPGKVSGPRRTAASRAEVDTETGPA